MTPLTASTDLINDPIRMPNQIIPNPNTRISTNASTASATPPLMRHPMHSPVSAITTTPIDECIRLAMLRPINTADRRMGSDRNLSMIPFSTSAVMPVDTTNAVNTMVCAWMPGSRNSR